MRHRANQRVVRMSRGRCVQAEKGRLYVFNDFRLGRYKLAQSGPENVIRELHSGITEEQKYMEMLL